MDKNKNYYEILGVTHNSTNNEIKKAYYGLSKQYHPDKNKDIDTSLFNSITEAYDVFCNEELRKEYDMKSKYGKDYNEYYELFDVSLDFSYNDGKEKLDKFKKYEVNNIDIIVKDDFNGNIEYERWVKCKSCDGTGKNLSSKIIIRDNDGNIMKIFDGDDGCDFCNGVGKNSDGTDCRFCSGKGKVGLNKCDACSGEGRILGKQKLKGIKLNGDETKIELMGHYSKNGTGHLFLVKK